MLENINVLQLGDEDWNELYHFQEDYIVTYCWNDFCEEVKKPYDIVFIDRSINKEEMKYLNEATKAYTLYVTDRVKIKGELAHLYKCKRGQIIPVSGIQQFIDKELRNFFPTSYGEKFFNDNIAIAQGFVGKVLWRGNCSVDIEGNFGDEFYQIAYWRKGVPIFLGQAIDFWLEYSKEGDVEIKLEITQISKSSIAHELKKWVFNENDLEDIVTLDNDIADCNIFVSIMAKGRGKISIVSLHNRYSRRGHGFFLPGGERFVTSKREEVFCYFDPGNLKPPLNIYFSGYKTMEGFEGYNMMRKTGCPFLLVSEARLEGGSFYMGDEEYEKLVESVIKRYINILGFSSKQVIMSGLSMGTYGALYYACDIHPYAIIVGKPLASIGDVAANEKRFRPGGFPTSLDVLKFICGSADYASVQLLNNKFWEKFSATDWSGSKFIISYMIEDDYDDKAYEMLLEHLNGAGVQVYGKGIHGRHNDNTRGIVNWFISQLNNELEQQFGRMLEG